MRHSYFLLFLSLLAACSKNVELKDKYKSLTWSEDLREVGLKLEREVTEGEVLARKFRFDEKSSFKLLEVTSILDVSEERARKLIKAKNLLVKEAYETQATPYSGSVTKEAGCIGELKLISAETDNPDQLSYYFNVKSTERFVFGICLEEQNVYKTQILHLYCKKTRELFDIKIHYLKSEPNLSLEIANCKSISGS